jgi:hypothetical protein
LLLQAETKPAEICTPLLWEDTLWVTGSLSYVQLSGCLGLRRAARFSKAVASDVIDDWANVKTPAAPEIKAVTVDPKTTALIMGDLMNQSCAKRPRCVAALPAMKKLLGEARAAKVAVIYSTIPNTTTADIIPDVAPAADEPSVTSGVDKFFKTRPKRRE